MTCHSGCTCKQKKTTSTSAVKTHHYPGAVVMDADAENVYVTIKSSYVVFVRNCGDVIFRIKYVCGSLDSTTNTAQFSVERVSEKGLKNFKGILYVNDEVLGLTYVLDKSKCDKTKTLITKGQGRSCDECPELSCSTSCGSLSKTIAIKRSAFTLPDPSAPGSGVVIPGDVTGDCPCG